MPDIAILAAPNAAGTSLFGTMELFAIANRIIRSTGSSAALFNTTLCSLGGASVKSLEGIEISIAGAIENIAQADLLYVAPPSIGSKDELALQRQHWADTATWLTSEHQRYHHIASHCCGSFLLAQAGLLAGGSATTAWWLSDLLAAEYPDIRVDHNAIVVQSGRCTTAAGTSAYQDMALGLVSQLASPSVGRLTSKYLMADRQRHSQSAYRLDLNDGNASDELVSQARVWIKKHLAIDFKIDDLARALAVSPRTLLRRFQQHAGYSPQTLVQTMRVERSKVLFETTDLPLADIARRCGYLDESAFRRVFQRYCGLSPKAYRLRFKGSCSH